MLWWTARGLTSEKPWERLSTVKKLSLDASAQATECLASALDDCDPEVRKAAAIALDDRDWKPTGKQKLIIASLFNRLDEVASYGEVGLPFLVEVLKRASNPERAEELNLGLWAIRVLSRMDYPAAVKVLATALVSNNLKVRLAAAQALPRDSTTLKQESLVALLQSGADTIVLEAARALGSMANEDAIPPLLQVPVSDDQTRNAVSQAVASIACRTSFQPVLDALLGSRRESGRAAEVLRGFPAVTASFLESSLRQKPTFPVLTIALDLLPSVSSLTEVILDIVENYDLPIEMRFLAVRSLGATKDARAFPVLLSQSQDASDGELRAAITRALAGFPYQEALDAVEATLDDPEPVCRLTGIELIARWGATEAVPLLARALADQDTACRLAAVRALRNIGSAEGVSALAGVLRDPEPQCRRAVIDALIQSGTVEAERALIHAIGDTDEVCRIAIAAGLGSFSNNTEMLPALIGALDDTSDDVSKAAARSLGKLAAPDMPPKARAICAVEGNDWRQAVQIGYPAMPYLLARIRNAYWRPLRYRDMLDAFDAGFDSSLIPLLIEIGRAPWASSQAATYIEQALVGNPGSIAMEPLEQLASLHFVDSSRSTNTWWEPGDSYNRGSWQESTVTSHIVLDCARIRTLAADELHHRLRGDLAAIAASECQRALTIANLKCWQMDDGGLHWIRTHTGKWNHSEWLALIDELRRSRFWPMDEASVGATLEAAKSMCYGTERYDDHDIRRHLYFNVL